MFRRLTVRSTADDHEWRHSMITATPTNRADTTVNGATGEPEHHDVVVIGGGQAGLATGYHLARHGLDFVILDAHRRVGDAWRQRWDSLTLFTPAKVTHLPGMPFPAPPHSFPTKDAVGSYLESYADLMHLPVRIGVEATRVSRSADGGWRIETSDHPLTADAVVIATGGYQRPNTPPWAADLSPDIAQLHSSAYRNPSQLPPGPVLVVGASHSGAAIAIEVARAHRTLLAGRDTGQVPLPTKGRLVPLITPVIWFAMNHVLTVDTPVGRRASASYRNHGLPLEHPSRADIVAAGVERIIDRVAGARDGKPMLADGRALDVRTVIWCTGFTGDYGWIDGLGFSDDGYPAQERGVVPGLPGLYFVGLKFQRSAASALVGGVGRDARHVADHLAARVRAAA
jgi:putative flavoprotein involved in K+ transport